MPLLRLWELSSLHERILHLRIHLPNLRETQVLLWRKFSALFCARSSDSPKHKQVLKGSGLGLFMWEVNHKEIDPLYLSACHGPQPSKEISRYLF